MWVLFSFHISDLYWMTWNFSFSKMTSPRNENPIFSTYKCVLLSFLFLMSLLWRQIALGHSKYVHKYNILDIRLCYISATHNIIMLVIGTMTNQGYEDNWNLIFKNNWDYHVTVDDKWISNKYLINVMLAPNKSTPLHCLKIYTFYLLNISINIV